jgi:predicted nuclease with TOPRIM domain
LASGRSGRRAGPRPQRDDPQFVTLREYLERLRADDQRLAEERDRRYAEVARERAKALRVQNRAYERGLDSARADQKDRDDQVSQLREQVAAERALYITKADHEALIARVETITKPLTDFMAAQQGRLIGEQGTRATVSDVYGRIIAGVGVLVSVVVLILLLVHH